MRYKNILWDWNGTILNDAPIAFEATNILLKRYNYPTITFEYYRDNVDTPIVNFYSKIFDLSKENMDTLDNEWCVLYNKLSDKINLQKDVESILKKFSEHNCHQTVLSAFRTEEIIKFADKFSVRHYFKDILGTQNIVMESKTMRGKKYMQENNLEPKDTLYIGDTVHDCDTAKGLGIDCVLLSCGQQSEKVLKKCDVLLFDSFKKLGEYLL